MLSEPGLTDMPFKVIVVGTIDNCCRAAGPVQDVLFDSSLLYKKEISSLPEHAINNIEMQKDELTKEIPPRMRPLITCSVEAGTVTIIGFSDFSQ